MNPHVLEAMSHGDKNLKSTQNEKLLCLPQRYCHYFHLTYDKIYKIYYEFTKFNKFFAIIIISLNFLDIF